jgi:hypothetical protein
MATYLFNPVLEWLRIAKDTASKQSLVKVINGPLCMELFVDKAASNCHFTRPYAIDIYPFQKERLGTFLQYSVFLKNMSYIAEPGGLSNLVISMRHLIIFKKARYARTNSNLKSQRFRT